jgi:hypothetical protein
VRNFSSRSEAKDEVRRAQEVLRRPILSEATAAGDDMHGEAWEYLECRLLWSGAGVLMQ